MLMKFQNLYMPHVSVFAIAIEKASASARGYDPRTLAWDFALQRVDRFCQGPGERAMLFPDEGHGSYIRRLVRRKRRHATVPRRWGAGSFTIPTDRLVEDPNDRQSHDSYFTQLADWNAFAAHRSVHVDPRPKVDSGMWDQLGPRLLLAVNSVAGGPPGIKKYP